MLTETSRMAAAAVGTTVGLYVVVTQDTNHGAEHHPLGDPHGEGGAHKTGNDSTVGEQNKEDEPEEESNDESNDESKEESRDESKDESNEEPKSDQQNPSKPTKENSEEKDHQSPDQSDKVSVLT
jgi:cobalamin biosynthesis protein CobT